jgi:cysteinyl-tRNA synthetase
VIEIYDTMRGRTVPLQTREEGRVAMYGCGPTVYNYAHIGNARTFLWYDLIRRYLTYRGFDVTYVMNYTDVDDKLIARMREERIPLEGLAAKYATALEEDLAALGVAPPTILCRATDHIDDMIKAIESLVERGHAYEADGDVWFSIETFPRYGRLSHRSIDDMRAGERVEPAPGKRHPLDFSLWKAAKEGEPAWSSPWGPGRPGWHIECSVMATKYLGTGFDLHAGGADLVFPHHENEIAQAEALTGEEPFVRLWVHAGLVQMDTDKMSKSLGNVALVRDVLKHWDGEVVRYWCLTGSYRTQLTFSRSALDDARSAYDRWRTFLQGARHALGDDAPETPVAPRRPPGHIGDGGAGEPFAERFVAAMDDDLNSAGALAAVHELVREANRRVAGAGSVGDDRRALLSVTQTFLELTAVLGFEFPARGAASTLVADLVALLLDLREEARRERSFERADAIRARLARVGVVVEDTSSGARWRLEHDDSG